jgi:hypothetical protein
MTSFHPAPSESSPPNTVVTTLLGMDQSLRFPWPKCNAFAKALMIQITLAVGINDRSNVINLYTGEDAAAAQAAVDAAGQAGTINIGYVFKNPPPVVTLRYGPVVPEAAGAS